MIRTLHIQRSFLAYTHRMQKFYDSNRFVYFKYVYFSKINLAYIKISLLSATHGRILKLETFLCKCEKYARLAQVENFVIASTNCNEILRGGTKTSRANSKSLSSVRECVQLPDLPPLKRIVFDERKRASHR